MNRNRIYIILAAFSLLSQPGVALAQAKSDGSKTTASAKQPVTAKPEAKQETAKTKSEDGKSKTQIAPAARSDDSKSKAQEAQAGGTSKQVPTSQAGQLSGSKRAPTQPQLTPVDPTKLGKDNAIMQAQAELEIKPDPVADILFKAFHYITMAALGGSLIFGTMWYFRHKKRLASGFYDEEDDDDDEEFEEQPTDKSEKSTEVGKEKTVTAEAEENGGGKTEATSDSTPQPVGSDESK